MFLIKPESDWSVSYPQFVSDLEESVNAYRASGTERAVGLLNFPFNSDETYQQLVSRLVEVIVGVPQVEWNITTFGRPNVGESENALSCKSVSKVLNEGAVVNLETWRKQFLDSPSHILLQTSGSSGKPKQVWHTVKSLTRGIKLDAKHRNDVWGLTNPLDHLAGLQVFFQALLNLNPLVNLYQVSASVVHTAIDTYQITHLSCTPTFLRMLLADSRVHPSLIRLTSGGERLDRHLLEPIQAMFPNARLTNIYAATETGTLLVSHNDQFQVPAYQRDEFRIIDGELWLHQNLKVNRRKIESLPTSASDDLGNAEATDSFWNTGDLVEVVRVEPLTIRFIGRKHEWFNVAGFRVDPVRLEEIAGSHPAIAQAQFFGIPNSVTENLVGCNLVVKPNTGNPDQAAWKQWLAARVERHEVPRIVNIVEAIETTDSGKVRRS